MSKILGLDLGTNSIGWAVVDDAAKKIVDAGVRIFPMGVNLEKGSKEESKNATRREKRGIRRQSFRRKMRKELLLKELQLNNMAPTKEEEYIEWYKQNPYQIRARAVDKPISLMEMGRAFYHMIQRRGFKSNRKAGSNEDSTIFKGDAKNGKIGISETKEHLREYKTLGQYLASINPHETRIRNRYTTRKMYIDEFNVIWEEQKKYHQNTLTDALKEKLGINEKGKETGILFHQRPLKTQKHLIGKCTFETEKTKCPISAIPFEMFRAWQWSHTVEYNGEKLTKEQREKVVYFLLSKDKLTFKDIRKQLGYAGEANNFNYSDDDRIVGSYTILKLSKLFGKKWEEFSDKEKEDVWHVIYNATDPEWLNDYAVKKWGFNEKQIKDLNAISFKQDYASLSRKAINNILEFLPDYRYDEAVVLAGVKNAIGGGWNNLEDNKRKEIIDTVVTIVASNENYIDLVKEYLKNNCGLNDDRLKKLYHHSAKIEATTLLSKLPLGLDADKEISSLRNPMVIQALFELRSLINQLVEEHNTFDEIKLEMARDLKSSSKQRAEVRTNQKQLEVENDKIKKELENLNQPITHDNLLKYKLWKECRHICPYTGEEIGISDLFTGRVQIEHIIPWSRSLNDSYNNKTLCYSHENIAKGNKTPFEYYGGDEKKWHEVKERAKAIFANPKTYSKFKNFVTEKVSEDFISRQLNDTRYISKEAKTYLEKICKRVKVAPGQMTAHLRHHWGLNSILNSDSDIKTRDDHRHHAIDAIVMACHTQTHLNEISKWNRYNKTYELEKISEPWEGFRSSAKEAVNKILVSHKSNNKVLASKTIVTKKGKKTFINKGIAARGQLHLETVYGKHKDKNDVEYYHVRKSLEAIDNKAKVNKIVDPVVRDLVFNAIEKAGGYTGDKKDKVPANAFFKTDEAGIKQPLVYLPNENGNPIPIKKVRIKESSSGAVQLKGSLNQWVEPGSNHHIIIYENHNGELEEQVVTFWDVVERKKQNDLVFKLPENGKAIVTTLQINDLFILGVNEDIINWNEPNQKFLSDHLYRVQKLSTFYYTFRKHVASSLDNKDEEKSIRSFKGWKELTPIKVKISPTGKIQKI
jgi:CRISPR-associated endonuclease Csn1